MEQTDAKKEAAGQTDAGQTEAKEGANKVELYALNGSELAGDRNERGQFQPGHKVKGGRPKREVEQSILAGLTGALTQERITELITQAIEIAIEQKSTKGIVSVLQLVAAYGLGTPVQRSEDNDTDQMTEYLQNIIAARGQRPT